MDKDHVVGSAKVVKGKMEGDERSAFARQ